MSSPMTFPGWAVYSALALLCVTWLALFVAFGYEHNRAEQALRERGFCVSTVATQQMLFRRMEQSLEEEEEFRVWLSQFLKRSEVP